MGLLEKIKRGKFRNYLIKRGIDVNLLQTDFQTINKIRIISNQQMIRLDFEKTRKILQKNLTIRLLN